MDETYGYIICGGGTAGCVVAGRLAEDSNVKILLLEAGPHNKDLETVHMVGGWSQNFDKETDWNITTQSMKGVDGRQVKVSRGRFLGGSSGVNGTLCIRGSKQDYDDWGLKGWGGEEMMRYMSKVSDLPDCVKWGYTELLTSFRRRASTISLGSKPMRKHMDMVVLCTPSRMTWHQFRRGCSSHSNLKVSHCITTCLPLVKSLTVVDM
jgi:choline dehydrogenase-like flavoprotein